MGVYSTCAPNIIRSQIEIENMKTMLRVVCGILALLSLLLAGARIYSMSDQETASVMQMMGLLFPISVTILCGYMAIKGRMPFMEDQKLPPAENPRQE